jgi:hypothetical protein
MDFSKLRPSAPTSIAIKEALNRAQAMSAAVLGNVSSAKAYRDGMLLDGDAKQLAAAEKALIEARGDEERLEAIVAELTSRLAATTKAEAVSDVRCSLEDARDATDARRAWWEQNGKQLQAMLREATALHHKQKDAVDLTRRKQLKLGEYDDHAELSVAIYAEVPQAEDIDDVTWRILEKVAEAWSWCAGFEDVQEAA